MPKEEPVKRAEFNMGALDYERLSIFIITASQAVVILLNDTFIQQDPSRIVFAVGAVYEVYRELRRFAYENSKFIEDYDAEFKRIFKLAIEETNKNKAIIADINSMQRSDLDIRLVDCPSELYTEVSDLYNKVLDLKHKFGFDVPTKERRDLKSGFEEMKDIWEKKESNTGSTSS